VVKVVDNIDDPSAREREVSRILRQGMSVSTQDPDWIRVAIGLLLAGAVFYIGYRLEGSASHAESSKTLLRSFDILFTALLGLLGIETAKQKT
jgi:hypothetical protein